MALPHPPARKRSKMPERKKLEPGQFIASEKSTYRVESVLGSGGFGDVYKVVCVKDEKLKWAMKTEYFDPRKRKLLNRLKVEMGVFTEIQKAPPARKKHFIEMIDKGQTEQFKFIVMEIVSHSLEDIRKCMMNNKLSWSSCMKVASQTLAAIADLHSVGYIHRDIKPHNFAIGRPPLHVNIYMLDFGIARKYCEKDGKIRVPRERVTFLGTVKFASRKCHTEKEQSRLDDLEVWCYMVLELFEQENLIWRRQTDRMQILQMKERLFTHTEDLELRMPNGFKRIIDYIKRLNFADEPDYAAMDAMIWAAAKLEKIDVTVPLDWLDKVMPEKLKPKKKGAAARIENDDDSADRRRRQRREEKEKERASRRDKGQPSEKKEDEDEEDEDVDEETKDKKSTIQLDSRGSVEGRNHTKQSTHRIDKMKKRSKKETPRNRTTSKSVEQIGPRSRRKKNGAKVSELEKKSVSEMASKSPGTAVTATSGHSKESINTSKHTSVSTTKQDKDKEDPAFVKSCFFDMGMDRR